MALLGVPHQSCLTIWHRSSRLLCARYAVSPDTRGGKSANRNDITALGKLAHGVDDENVTFPKMHLSLQVSPPKVTLNGPLQLLITNLDYDEHKGRIAIGKVTSGSISRAETILIGRPGDDLHCS